MNLQNTDFSRIIATFRDNTNAKIVKREIGVGLQSFATNYFSNVYALINEVIKDWIVERGNPQHSSETHKADLRLIGWNFYTIEEAEKI